MTQIRSSSLRTLLLDRTGRTASLSPLRQPREERPPFGTIAQISFRSRLRLPRQSIRSRAAFRPLVEGPTRGPDGVPPGLDEHRRAVLVSRTAGRTVVGKA